MVAARAEPGGTGPTGAEPEAGLGWPERRPRDRKLLVPKQLRKGREGRSRGSGRAGARAGGALPRRGRLFSHPHGDAAKTGARWRRPLISLETQQQQWRVPARKEWPCVTQKWWRNTPHRAGVELDVAAAARQQRSMSQGASLNTAAAAGWQRRLHGINQSWFPWQRQCQGQQRLRWRDCNITAKISTVFF